MMDNRFSDAVGLLMRAAERFQALGVEPELMREMDDFIATVHPMECGPFARNVIAEETCETCKGDPQVCATIPGLRHCEAAMREPQGGIAE